MNHPTPAQWMSRLYDEDTEQQRRDLDAHLRDCPECTARMRALRAGMVALDDWTLPRNRATRSRPILQWAAAAAVLLLAGAALGRFSAPGTASLQTSLRQELDHKLAAEKSETRQLLEDFARDIEQKRGADANALLVALRQMDARRGSEAARLRRDLDTVAVFADARLSEAQEQLYQLATLNPPAGRSPGDDR